MITMNLARIRSLPALIRKRSGRVQQVRRA
jgi:hypothetical protein